MRQREETEEDMTERKTESGLSDRDGDTEHLRATDETSTSRLFFPSRAWLFAAGFPLVVYYESMKRKLKTYI
jgi:hypothetical protein